jgi:hypothetical protein
LADAWIAFQNRTEQIAPQVRLGIGNGADLEVGHQGHR